MPHQMGRCAGAVGGRLWLAPPEAADGMLGTAAASRVSPELMMVDDESMLRINLYLFIHNNDLTGIFECSLREVKARQVELISRIRSSAESSTSGLHAAKQNSSFYLCRGLNESPRRFV